MRTIQITGRLLLLTAFAVGCEQVPTLPDDSKTKGFEPPDFHVAAPFSHPVTQANILALINGPPAATASANINDLQGDAGIIQSAAFPMASGDFLYGYQWECHAGPDFDILTTDIPMAGTTPVLRDIDGDGSLDDSWAITDVAFNFTFMPYDQNLTGLLALCGSDIFIVDPNDFVTGFSFSGGLVTFSNNDGVFNSSNLFGFIACTSPQVVQTTGGGGNETGTAIVGTIGPFPVVAPTADATPPTLTASAAPSTMWPPNHKYVSINLSAAGSDNCSAVTFTATVTSNEADNARGRGDGNTTGDIRVTTASGSVLLSSDASPTVSFDPVNDQLELRAERAGRGSGRVYTIVVTATDASGNSSSVTVTVTVTHDQG